MSENTKLDFETFDAQAVLAEIQKDVETKGSLDITELANQSVGQSNLLKAIEEVCGESPFAYVMKSSYEPRISEVRVKLNPDILLAKLPAQLVTKVKALAVKIRREEVNAKNPEFQAFKRAIVGELAKAILVESKGSVSLTVDDKFGTDFKFTHAHTSDAKVEAIAAAREERETQNSGGKRLGAMRTKFRRARGA